MTDVEFSNGKMIVIPKGLDKLWGFRGRLEFPIDHITQMTIESKQQLKEDGKWDCIKIRALGLGLPNKKVGTFMGNRTTSYLNISGPDDILFVELHSEKYDFLFLTVADPNAIKERFLQIK
ncbi:hypothetical protein [Lentilactobacillus kefiri]|uniref:hypothetical protein n=1 Tax=Lentilactobacillus kefiri TaxID=33962 RepID=UPI00345EEF56